MADPSPYTVFTETRQFALDTARRIAPDLPGRSSPSSILWSHDSWHTLDLTNQNHFSFLWFAFPCTLCFPPILVIPVLPQSYVPFSRFSLIWWIQMMLTTPPPVPCLRLNSTSIFSVTYLWSNDTLARDRKLCWLLMCHLNTCCFLCDANNTSFLAFSFLVRNN